MRNGQTDFSLGERIKQSIELFFSVSTLIDAKQTVKKKLFKQSTSEFKKKKTLSNKTEMRKTKNKA